MNNVEKMDIAITDKNLNPADRLELILYLYNQLHRSLREDKDLLLKNITDHAALLRDFKNQINQFEALEHGVKSRVVASIEEALKNILSDMNKKIAEAATDRVEKIINALEKVVKEAGEILSSYYQESLWDFWKMIFLSLLIAIVASVLSVHLALKRVEVHLPEEEMVTYQEGQFIQNLWPKLSKSEQQRLLDIGKGKLNPDSTVSKNTSHHRHPHKTAANDNEDSQDVGDNNDTVN